MEEATTMFSTSSLLSLYASLCTFFMFLQNAYHELVPRQLQSYLFSKLGHYFSWKKPQTCLVTIIIDDSWGGFRRNKLIKAANAYVSTKIGPKNRTIRIGKFKKPKKVITSLVDGEEVVDIFDGIKITWQLVCEDQSNPADLKPEQDKVFEVTFEEKYRDKVVSEYFNHVLNTCEEMKQADKGLKLYSLADREFWDPIDFSHPASFETLAMDSELKQAVIDDLDRFLGRKEYYRRVGKAWKRSYLLYGPPGAGKSSLVAAMAYYLKVDIYELEIPNVVSEYYLRKSLLQIEGKCIIVIEDIDCNSRPSGSESESNQKEPKDEDSDGEDYYAEISAADVLRCIEGLWARCEEQRIVVLTTNREDALEAELDVPGQIDMRIHMSYCTVQGFRVLALNYLGIEQHPLFEEIDGLIQISEVTPASLAGELLKTDDADAALSQVINFLKQKKIEKSGIDQVY